MNEPSQGKDSLATRLGRYEAKRAIAKHTSPLAKLQPLPKSPNLIDVSFANPQVNCTFLQLFPFEVRSTIYRELLSDIDKIVHIENSANSQKCQPCLITESYKPPGRDESSLIAMFDNNSWGMRHRECRAASWRSGKPSPALKTYFSIVKSCRKIYIETIGGVYSKVSFHFIHPFAAQRFFTTTPKFQLDLIRSVRVSWMLNKNMYQQNSNFIFIRGKGSRKEQVEQFAASCILENSWQQTCDCLSNMRSLTSLQVIIQSLKINMSEQALLKPLLSITHVGDFEVLLPWSQERPLWTASAGILPFTIRRPHPFEDGYYVSEGRQTCRGYSRRRARRSLARVVLCYVPVYYKRIKDRLVYIGYI